MKIEPCTIFFPTWKQGVISGASVDQLTEALGFEPNEQGDPWKVTAQWRFTIDGERFCVWDYHGSAEEGRFSFFGPRETLAKALPGFVIST